MASLNTDKNTQTNKQKSEQATKENIKKAIHSKTDREVTASSFFENGKPYTFNVDQVSTYDKNTRIVKNEEYEALYASLKAKGFNQGALDVTQRPGDDPMQVFLKAGGNTTFSILKALYEKTGDEKYYTFIGIYHDWTSESDCIIEHLKENVKGTPTFIDTAIGVNQFRIEKQAELGVPLSDNELIDTMSKEGYSKINKATLSHINFTIETMWPVCPELLKSGLSAWKVKDIIKLEKEASTLHDEMFPDLKKSDWKAKFIQALETQEKRCIEGEAYDYKELYYAVLDTFEKDHTKRNRIDLLLDQRINNKKGQAYDPDLLTEDPVENTTDDITSSKPSSSTFDEDTQEPPTTTIKNTVSQTTVIIDEGDDEDLSVEEGDLSSSNDNNHQAPYVENVEEQIAAKTDTPPNLSDLVVNPSSLHQADHGQWTPENKDHESNLFSDMAIRCADSKEVAPLPTAVNELRQIMFTKATLFQQYVRVPVTVVPIDSGTGFVLNKIPDKQVLQACINFDERDNPRTKLFHKNYIGWWLLLGFTDMLQLNHLRQFDLINKYQVPGNLKDVLMQKMASYASIMELDLINGITHSTSADLAPLFLSDASHKELQLFIELQLTYNKLMRTTNQDIWSTIGRGVEV